MRTPWIVAAEELLPAGRRDAAAGLLGPFDGKRDWHPITTAPFNHVIEVRVADAHGVRALPVACRQTTKAWMNADLGVHANIDPVAWRP